MRSRTALVAVGSVVAAAALLAGCGGGDGGSSALNPTGTTAATTAPSASTTVPTSGSTGAPGGRGIALAAAPWQLATPIGREVLVTDGKDLYLAGGLDTAGVSSGAVAKLGPATGKSTSVGTLSLPVHDAMGVWRDGQIVVVAGGSPPIRTEVQSVTPGGATKVIGQLPAPPRADHVVAQVNNTIYALGGGDEASNLVGTVAASADGGVTWRAAGSLVEPVRYPAIAVIDGAIYLFGGVSTTGGTDTASVQRYDPKTEQTTVAAKLPAPLSHSTAVVLDDVVYLLGGYVNNRLGGQVWRFDPRAVTTADAGVALPAPLSDSAAVVIDGVGYLVGGQGTDKKPVTTVTLVKPRT
ncbi:MAG: hypothetical protein WDA60_08410 [Acidimicrobiia bacterium]|jgi:hypothetical protein